MIDYTKIAQAATEAIASAEMIALTIAVVEGSQIRYAQGFGTTRNDDKGGPVTTNTIFPYSSINKTLNAIVIMRLVEQGHLELDRPVVEYLPGFTFRNVAYGKRVTLRHLLSHTSGLPAGGRGYGLDTDDALARAVWEEIPHYRFSAEPGRFYIYASTAYCMSGYVAEAVMGRSYDELLADLVLKPLGINLRWDLSGIQPHEIAYSHYLKNETELLIREKFPANRAGHPSSFYYGSTYDLAKVAVMLLNAGQLLSAESIATMSTPYRSTHLDNATHFINHLERHTGLGLKAGVYRGQRLVRHGGVTPGYSSYFQLFPDYNRAAIIQMTTVGYEAQFKVVQAVHDAVLELSAAESTFTETPAPEAPLPSDLNLEKFVGTYISPSHSDKTIVSVVDGTLHLEAFGRKMALTYRTDGDFVGWATEQTAFPVHFEFDENGSAEYILVFDVPFRRNTETPPAQPDLVQWERYVGQYQDPFNTDPDDIIKVKVADSKLYLWEGNEEQETEQLSKYRFLSHMGIAEFEVSAENEVVALQIAHTARYWPLKATL